MAELRLSQDQAAAVFRRAAELDVAATAGDGASTGLDRTAVELAAVEAGLSPAAVRRALTELDAGQLTVGRRPRFRWKGSTATVERLVPVDAAVATRHLEAYLSRQMLRAARRRPEVSVWEPASGLTAQVVRGTDVLGRLRLKAVSRITLFVTPAGSGSLVRVDLDFSDTRRARRRLALAGSAAGGAAAASVVWIAVATGAEFLLGATPAGAGVAGLSWAAARSTYAKKVDGAVTAVELALDALDRPDGPDRRGGRGG